MDSSFLLASQYKQKLNNDIAGLHFPNRFKPRRTHHKSNSLIAVIHSPSPEVEQRTTKFGYIAKSALKKGSQSQQLPKQHKKSTPKFRELLSVRSRDKILSEEHFPINSKQQLEEMARANNTVKTVLIKNAEEKKKVDRLILSTKYSEQTKSEYLRKKQFETKDAISKELEGIYIQFFKEQYETQYGNFSKLKFNEKMEELLVELKQKLR